MPGGLGVEVHIAGEMRSRAVSANLGRLCMVDLLRAAQLYGLGSMVCGAWRIIGLGGFEVVVSGEQDVSD